jgi:hypothetical protein
VPRRPTVSTGLEPIQTVPGSCKEASRSRRCEVEASTESIFAKFSFYARGRSQGVKAQGRSFRRSMLEHAHVNCCGVAAKKRTPIPTSRSWTTHRLQIVARNHCLKKTRCRLSATAR